MGGSSASVCARLACSAQARALARARFRCLWSGFLARFPVINREDDLVVDDADAPLLEGWVFQVSGAGVMARKDGQVKPLTALLGVGRVRFVDGNVLNWRRENLERKQNRNPVRYKGIQQHRDGYTVTVRGKYVGWKKTLDEAIELRKAHSY